MNVILTGGTGMIGKKVLGALLTDKRLDVQSVQVLSRQTEAKLKALYPMFRDTRVEVRSRIADISAVDGGVVVNLAGESIADKRWTDARKKQLIESRVSLTNELFDHLSQVNSLPHTLISASAIGYYGIDQPNEIADEKSAQGKGFSAKLCADWEQAALRFASSKTSTKGLQENAVLEQTRVHIMRLGIVFASAKEGGFIGKMRPIFKVGLGGPIGDGSQWINWVYIDNVVKFVIEKCLAGKNKDEAEGSRSTTFTNLVSNAEIRQKQFASTYAELLNRPSIIPTPAFTMRLAFGEMADELLLNGKRVRTQLHDSEASSNYTSIAEESALEVLKRALRRCEAK